MKTINLPRLEIEDGTLEGVKWFALFLMTIAHIDKYLFNQALPYAFEASRLVLPLFCFILAYNLARPFSVESGRYSRAMKHLLFFGVIASFFYIPLSGQLKGCFPASGLLKGAYPLNIMFLLFVAVGVIYLLDLRRGSRTFAAILLFFIGGAFVEFWWFGLFCCFAAWLYCKKPTFPRLSLWIFAISCLYVINCNFWALGSIPIIFLATKIKLNIPRYKYIFYIYYPAHLAVIFLISLFFKA